MIRIDPSALSVRDMHAYLLGAVIPRPIAFASTVDASGNVNLSPFSFFNCFSANPPVLVFSPSRRGRDNTTKHTLENLLEVPEVSISIVNHAIVEQMSLSSTEYDKGVNEFVKAGLTEAVSERIRPPHVGESPVSFECRVIEVKPLGDQGGAGNLVICEVMYMHVDEHVLDAEGKIDPYRLDAVARLGGNYYSRVIPESIFEIRKPLGTEAMGFDRLPAEVRTSSVLTGNELAQLASVWDLPGWTGEVAGEVRKAIAENGGSERARHRLASEYLRNDNLICAWACLLIDK